MSDFRQFELIAGDRENLGWELRQAPAAIVDHLAVARQAARRALDAARLVGEAAGCKEETSEFSRFRIDITDGGRFIKTGLSAFRNEGAAYYSSLVQVARSQLMTRNVGRTAADEYLSAMWDYRQVVAPLQNAILPSSGYFDGFWRVAGYLPGGSLVRRARDDCAEERGHYDEIGTDSVATSLQLTDGGSLWTLEGFDTEGTPYRNDVVQEIGQVLVLQASPHNQAGNDMPSTPHHYVHNPTSSTRMTHLEFYISEAAVDEAVELAGGEV